MMGIYLYHGKNEFLLSQELKKLRSEDDVSLLEVSTYEDCDFSLISQILNSIPFLGGKNRIIIRQVLNEGRVPGLIEELIEYLGKNESLLKSNEIYLFNFGPVPQNLKVYKFVKEKGKILEFGDLPHSKIKNSIAKNIDIDEDAIEKLLSVTSGNLFVVKNEIDKLKALKRRVTSRDIDLYVASFGAGENIWKVGQGYADLVCQPSIYNLSKLVGTIDHLIKLNVDEMAILYTIYNFNFNLIKLKTLKVQKKSFKEILTFLSYPFLKSYFKEVDSIPFKTLYDNNRILLGYEYNFKNGLVDPNLGLKQSIMRLFLGLNR